MGLDLLCRIQTNPDHDQQGGTAKIKRHIQFIDEEFRDDTYDCQVNGARKGDLRENGVNIVRGSLSRANTRNKPPIFFEVICHIHRIHDHCRIEETKKYDQSDIHECVEE